MNRCSWAVIPLRLMLGGGMVAHGYPKLFQDGGHDQFAGMLSGIGVPAPAVAAWLVGGLELFGGILLVLGALTRFLSTLFVIEMIVAGLAVHLPSGFNAINIVDTGPGGPTFGMPGYEVNLLYVAGFLALLIAGAGQLSVDRALGGSIGRAWLDRRGEPPARGWRKRSAPKWRRRVPKPPRP